MNLVQKIARGGWSGFGMATVGIDPNTFEVLNGHPNKIPTDKILGGVVQNCQTMKKPASMLAKNTSTDKHGKTDRILMLSAVASMDLVSVGQ